MATTIPFFPVWEPDSEPSSSHISAEQVQHVEGFIAGRINVEDCATNLTGPVREAQSARTMEDTVFAIFSFINSTAIRNLDYQSQLLSLVKAVQKLPHLDVPTPKVDEDGAHISFGDDGSKLWEDMPGFGHQFGDNLRSIQSRFYDEYNSSDTDRAKTACAEWTGAVTWSARLVTLRDPRIAGEFFLNFASYSISHVLERSNHPMFSAELPAAAMVFRFGSSELLRLCRQSHRPDIQYALYDYDDLPGLRGQGREPLWTGPGGYSLERWAFWKSRWRTIGTQSNLEPSNLRHAKSAAEAMETAELASST